VIASTERQGAEKNRPALGGGFFLATGSEMPPKWAKQSIVMEASIHRAIC
jgi:hypothetical protein